MNGGSLGLGNRSASYGSLQLQVNGGGGAFGVQTTTTTTRKPSKMYKDKDKENLFHRICKVAGRKKVGMLLICIVSAAFFGWNLYVGKVEDSPGSDSIRIRFNNTTISFPEISTNYVDQSNDESNKTISESMSKVEPNIAMAPPPPAYFLGYTLPHGHPCNHYSLPPPPADKKRTGPRPCPVCYLPVEEAISLTPKAPSYSPVLQNLTYVYEENLTKPEDSFGGSDFGGYPSLKQRNESYDIKESMTVHCGFVRGRRPGHHTGFDLDDSDLLDMEQCRGVVVASAIFGNFDVIQQPKNVSEHSKQNVCFFMFVDEVTEAYLKNSSHLDSDRKVGVWKIVVIHNPPYTDPRRTGKVPKLLMHRLFPNARYSIWLDGKLELVVDPFQILERFLWRKNATFAISRHYRRFDVFVEAEANKAAAKYDNASIDFQIDFYRKEGLTPYSQSKLPITSDVPEGCVILREHVPISNLFTCLWFNEVERFTSRDQISFSTVRDKIMSKVNMTLNMFWDCERRNFVIQKYHKDLLDHLRSHPPPVDPPPPPTLANDVRKGQDEKITVTSSRRGSGRHGKDRKGGSRSHRKINAGNRDTSSS